MSRIDVKMARYLLLLGLAFVSSVELKVQIVYHDVTDIVAESNGLYTVVSDSELVASRQGRLIVQHRNGTVLSETNLGYKPNELHSHDHGLRKEEGLHVVAAEKAERVSHCKYYDTHDPELVCNERENFSLSAHFVVSMLVEDNRVATWAIYYDSNNGEFTRLDLRAGTREFFPLPEDCTCSNHSNCLKPNEEPTGRIKVECDGGASYLYEVQSEFSYLLPPNVKRVATSKNRNLILAVQSNPAGHFQDYIIVTNRTTNATHAATQPLPGIFATASNPAIIHDLAVISANDSEICIFIRNNEIFYFEVVDLGRTFLEKKLPLHSNFSDFKPVGIKGVYRSSVVILATDGNGWSIHITVTVSGNNASGDDNATQSTSLPTDPISTPPGGTETPGSTGTSVPSMTSENKTNCTCTSSDIPVNSPSANTDECIFFKVSFAFVLIVMTLFVVGAVIFIMKRIRGSGRKTPIPADN